MTTKNDIARVIVQATNNMPELPAKDHFKVVRLARRSKVSLVDQYATALIVVKQNAERRQKKMSGLHRVIENPTETKAEIIDKLGELAAKGFVFTLSMIRFGKPEAGYQTLIQSGNPLNNMAGTGNSIFAALLDGLEKHEEIDW